jgi:hypothetical protein
MNDADQPVYDTFAVNSKSTVNQLAAANARHPCELFFRFTCNQKQSIAVQNIWKWVESDKAIQNIAAIDGARLFLDLRSDQK